MPNWCANNLQISGRSEHIAEIKKLMNGDLHPFYTDAIRYSIKFFIAGCAGIVKPTVMPGEQMWSLFNNKVTSCQSLSCGEDNAANTAFTQWLNLLATDPSLTKEVSQQIIALYQSSNLASFSLASATREQREIIHALFELQGYDWFNCFHSSDDLEKHWLSLDNHPRQEIRFDMRQVVPARLIPEIAGFNAKLFENAPTAYDTYIDLYGVKWPCAYELSLSEDGANYVEVDFDTPWAPPKEAVLMALSGQYQCTIEHYYSEAGCAYCGYSSYENGSLVLYEQDALEFGPEDEDGCCDVVGPAYIVEHVAHYGG